MTAKLAFALAALCLVNFLTEIDCSFIKPNNVPRVGRSNEDDPFDQDSSGYVIKTNKNIPRMGRRNYDTDIRFGIPKYYQTPAATFEQEEQEQIEPYYSQMSNMKK